MKKLVYLLCTSLLFTACSTNQKEQAAKSNFIYPVQYSEWEIGKSDYIDTVLEFYKAWDRKEAGKMANLFGDTLRLRIPTERDEIILPNNQINAALKKNRGMYDSTSNVIITAISLHDRERNEDWVFINTYNKWVEKNGKRDSLLYHDEWRLKNGKIDFLWSYNKVPTATFLNDNDVKADKKE